jgi:hypothetical protein
LFPRPATIGQENPALHNIGAARESMIAIVPSAQEKINNPVLFIFFI